MKKIITIFSAFVIIARISTEDSKAIIYIVPTNEEIVIAKDAYELTKNENKI